MENIKDSRVYIPDEEKYKKQTFSGYKKTQVMSQLKKCILKQELDRACMWAAELDISGHIGNLWETLIIYACNEINIINPALPIYIYKKYKEFLRLLSLHKGSEIQLRNNQESRNKLCDLLCVITLSPKKKLPKYSKIKDEDLIIQNIRKKTTANNLDFIKDFLTPNDPIGAKIAINEIALYLSSTARGTYIVEKCFYWIDWLFYFEKKQIQKYKKFLCQSRPRIPNTNKFNNDCVWFLWDVILHYAQRQNNRKLLLIVNCLYELYKMNFTKGKKNKRLVYIKYSVLLILNCIPEINFNTPIFYKNNIRFKANLNIDSVYYNLCYNRKNIGYSIEKPLEVTKVEQSPFYSKNATKIIKDSNKKEINLNDPSFKVKFQKYMSNKNKLNKTKKQIIMDDYQNYINKINKYNENVMRKNIIIKKKMKRLHNPVLRNINKLLRDKNHIQTVNIFKNNKNIVLKTSQKIKSNDKISQIYKSL